MPEELRFHQATGAVQGTFLNRGTKSPKERRLTANEEALLIRAIQAGDETAKQQLVDANKRLVINIAKAYRNLKVPIDTLIQQGTEGLIQAAERFDPNKGFRFSTYATHLIRQAINHEELP